MADINQEKLTFTFTVDQINAILGVLGNAPFVASAPLINEIQAQGSPQFAAIQDAANKADETAEAAAPAEEAKA